MDVFYLYLAAVGANWWAFMMAGPFIIDEAIKWLSPRGKAWLERNLGIEKRRRIEVYMMVFGVFLAGFLAFKDEHEARQRAETQNHGNAEQNQKILAAKSLIGVGIRQGETLSRDWPNKDPDKFEQEANEWENRMLRFISDAYGDGEESLFESDAGYIFYTDSKKQTDIKNWVGARIQRLNELLKRSDSLPMKQDFNPQSYKWRSN
jgi:hypothetical protein